MEELISDLDPDRDYGARSHDEVIDAIRAGEVVIKPGHSLPILRDAKTHMAVAGSGKAIVGEDARAWSNKEFQQRYADDFNAIWDAITHSAVVNGDPRSQKLLVEHGQGRAKEPPGAHGYDEELRDLLLAAMSQGPHMSNRVYQVPAEAVDVRDVSAVETDTLNDGTNE